MSSQDITSRRCLLSVLQHFQANARSTIAEFGHIPLELGLLAHWLQSTANVISCLGRYRGA
jgi:hypothetical protein